MVVNYGPTVAWRHLVSGRELRTKRGVLVYGRELRTDRGVATPGEWSWITDQPGRGDTW